MRLGVIGSGHVGLTTAVCLAYSGHTAVVADIDVARVKALQSGALPFFESHLDWMYDKSQGRVIFTTEYEDLAEVDLVLVAVPSPPGREGQVDLSYLMAAASSLGRVLRHRHASSPMLVVNKCTVPVGTATLLAGVLRNCLTDAKEAAPLSRELAATRFSVGSCPEFLREGRAVEDTLYPDRVVFGVSSQRDGQLLRDLYGPVISRTFAPPPFAPDPVGPLPKVMEVGVTTAELIKYAANAFLATKLSFINELAGLASAAGINVRDVADGIGLDHRIGRSFLNAGIGWGGSCLGKDIRGLINTAAEYQLPTPILSAVVDVNERQRGAAIRLLQQELNVLKGRQIGLMGLAFKPGTDDLRDAPSLEVAQRLLSLGAFVTAYDPVVRSVPMDGVVIRPSMAALADGADALVLVTEWDEFQSQPWETLAGGMARPVLIDGRNVLPAERLRAAGFTYRSIGQ